jgi:hypothetical protein
MTPTVRGFQPSDPGNLAAQRTFSALSHFSVITRAPAAIEILSALLHPIFAVQVPYASLFPAAAASHRFQPTAVAAAVAVTKVILLRFVALICGELAAANVTVFLVLKGPSKALSLRGLAVAKLIHRAAG